MPISGSRCITQRQETSTQAFEHLQRLIDARDPALIHLAVAPQWDSLRADPRFNECLARMKLRPVGTASGPMPESR